MKALSVLWALPVPSLLLDAQLRIVDANPAFEAFSATTQTDLLGRDPVDLQPQEERESDRLAIADWLHTLHVGSQHRMAERRLVDGAGRDRWFRATYTVLPDIEGRWLLATYHDTTAEHVARAQAERSLDELSQWFELSPSGMLVFDATGLIVRSNRAFDALIGEVPVSLVDAAEDSADAVGLA